MDPSSSDCSSMDSIRRAEVSRRGGVRVRGGRLPPIRIRDSALLPTSSKKVVAPKIPQRRLKVKEETPILYQVSQSSDNRRNCASTDSRQKSSRGRGPKVYLQSEGTFLGEGPALKLKKELPTFGYERGSRGSRSKTEDTKFDPGRLKYLFEDFDEDEPYDDSLLLPVRFPILKQEVKQEIKEEIKQEIKEEINQEIKEENKVEIKEEIKFEDLDADDVKRFIKKEPDDSESEDNKVVEKLEKVDISEKQKNYPFVDDIKFMKDEDTFLLLQLPSFLPFKKESANSNQSTTADKTSMAANRSEESEAPETDLKTMSEGHLGKLQILRSGEMRLVSGCVTMSIERTMEVPAVFEVVSIPNENSREDGDIIVLGRIERKLVVRPLVDKVILENEFKKNLY